MRMALDIIGQVLRTLWAHKLRSFLTMFGIAWGVGSLLMLVGLGEGFRSGQQKNMATIGQDIIFIWGGQIPAVPGHNQTMHHFFLTYKDYLNMNNVRMYIPFSTMRMYFPMKTERTIDDISAMNLQPVSRDRHAAALDQVHRIIARNHGFDPKNKEAFEGWDTVANAEMVGKIFTGMDVFLGSVGMVTVVLGAIGIINIMLVSVTERTREIGLMKAVGATHRNILMQFFLEGLFLTALSGGVGIGVTQALMTLMKVAPLPPMFDPPHIVPAAAAPAVASLSIAGIGAGLYPAPKAAMLRPVDALRTDER